MHFPTLPVNIPIELRPNAEKSVTFSADYTSPYTIYVSMNAKTVARLYPCLDPDKVSSDCKSEPPIDLCLQLLEGDRDISRRISINPPSVEKDWSQSQYVKYIGSVDLDRGKRYTLVVRSINDGAILQPTDPHLEVAVATSTIVSEMILRFLVEGICSILMLAGLIWGILRLFLNRKDTVIVK